MSGEEMAREVEVSMRVTVTVRDRNVIDRCVQNEDGWRDHYYDLRTPEDVLEHLAFNAAANGTRRVDRLDGWADLPSEAATMHVEVTDVYAGRRS